MGQRGRLALTRPPRTLQAAGQPLEGECWARPAPSPCLEALRGQHRCTGQALLPQPAARPPAAWARVAAPSPPRRHAERRAGSAGPPTRGGRTGWSSRPCICEAHSSGRAVSSARSRAGNREAWLDKAAPRQLIRPGAAMWGELAQVLTGARRRWGGSCGMDREHRLRGRHEHRQRQQRQRTHPAICWRHSRAPQRGLRPRCCQVDCSAAP